MATLSVIVANFNNEKYIAQCLDSIFKQTCRDLEIIAFDDGSSDDSAKIMRRYEQAYPAVFKGIFNRSTGGVANARHEAISAASGTYITTLDSDDFYYDAHKLENELALVLHYKTTRDQDIAAFSNIVLIAADNSLIGIWGNADNLKQGYICHALLARSCMIPRDFVLAKSVYFAIGGYDAHFPIYEDWDLKIRLSRQHEFVYTGINGTAYRQTGKGLSSQSSALHKQCLNEVFNKNIGCVDASERKKVSAAFKQFVSRMVV